MQAGSSSQETIDCGNTVTDDKEANDQISLEEDFTKKPPRLRESVTEPCE